MARPAATLAAQAAQAAQAALAVLAVLAAACGRDLEVPPAPTTPAEEPLFLGELSGAYGFETSIPDLFADDFPAGLTYSAAVPLDGHFLLVHLGGLGAAVDPVGMLWALRDRRIELSATTSGPAPVPGLFEAIDELAFARGEAGGGEIREPAGEGGRRLASRVAGGSGLDLALEYRVCAAGDTNPVRAVRMCAFDDSLSGVYVGTAAGCGAAGAPATIALGFYGAVFLGMRHPQHDRVFNGTYDRIEQQGFGFAGTIEDRRRFVQTHEAYPDGGSFTLEQVDGQLAFRMEIQEQGLGACVERIDVHRLAGGESSRCLLSTERGEGLELGARRSVEAGQRYLDVAVHPRGSWSVVHPAADRSIRVKVRRAGELGWLPQATPVPDGLTARVLLPAGAAAGAEYEVFAQRVLDLFNVEAVYATPVCAVDDGS